MNSNIRNKFTKQIQEIKKKIMSYYIKLKNT